MSELDAFDYPLPEEAIAQRPLGRRDASRLLVDGDPVRHMRTRDFPELVGPGDVVVFNRSKVVPARLHGTRPTGGRCEVLLLEELTEEPGDRWIGLVRPSRKLRPGTPIEVADDLTVVVEDDQGDGVRTLRLESVDAPAAIRRHGSPPLPPYIHEHLDDPDRYQTVYAVNEGSAAAPTAGLHFTGGTIESIQRAGATVAYVDLHVGLDTFRPVGVDRLADHEMHSERYSMSEDTWAEVRSADRVIAVGTTVVRALESVAATGATAGRTDLFIKAPFDFQVVDALMTNFHLPRSTLLVMIDAFTLGRWRHLYDIALQEGYRFLSFGDAMFVDRSS